LESSLKPARLRSQIPLEYLSSEFFLLIFPAGIFLGIGIRVREHSAVISVSAVAG
jgi:hypothetical protein